MENSFRNAFIDALKSSGHSLSEIAAGTGLSETRLETLRREPQSQTSVVDAKKIAAHFGVDLDTFLGDPELKGPLGIVELYTRLPEDVKRQFLAYGLGPAERPDPTEPE